MKNYETLSEHNMAARYAAAIKALTKAVQELNLTAEADTSYYAEHLDNGMQVHVVKRHHEPRETRL